MKKLLTLIYCLAFTTLVAHAQKPEMAKAIVRYKFSHIRDTSARDKPYTENMILFLGQASSAYKSLDKKLQEAMMRKQVEQQFAEQKGSGGPIKLNVTSRRATTRSEYYQFPGQNKLIRKETLITPYIIEEPMPVINWKISSDTTSFGTLLCQKATGHFKGRDYTAWFCPDLPFRAGPWKLNGLPGLIVEAYDTNKEVVFKFDGMEQVLPTDKVVTAESTPGAPVIKFSGMEDGNEAPNMIAVPANAVKTTEKEFTNLQEAMRKDPQAFMAAMGGANGGVAMRPAGGAGGPGIRTVVQSGSPAVINNPLELPEKKK